MYVSKDTLLLELPPYRDEWVMRKRNQKVKDIIRFTIDAYPRFESDYDRIGLLFMGTTVAQTCDNLYNFCKRNLKYVEETVEWQSIPRPAGMIIRGFCDCKGYAGFIGGCLGAMNRMGAANIDWEFCFASYDIKQRTPYHVFVVVYTEDGEIWIDPTPGANDMMPEYFVFERIKDSSMPLMENIGSLMENVGRVNAAGDLVYDAKTVGATTVDTVNPGMIPTPNGYPANTPVPYVTGGKIKFTPVPPNFTPNDTQLAYMMLTLQMWVNTYSQTPYNVFEWRSHTDGTGGSIATWVVAYCENFGSYEMAQLDKPINPFGAFGSQYASGTVTTAADMQRARQMYLRQIKDFDFGSPPAPFTPSALDKIMDTIAITVLKAVSNLLPVIGPAYANMWIGMYSQGATDQYNLQTGVVNAATNIVQQQQAAAAAAAAGNDTLLGDYTMPVVIGAGLLLLWWFYGDD